MVAAACSFSTHILGLSAIIFPLSGFIFNRFNIFNKQNSDIQNTDTSELQSKKIINNKTLIKSFVLYNSIIFLFYLFTIGKFLSLLSKEDVFPAIGLERFYYIFQGSFNVEPVFISLFFIIIVLNFKKFFQDRYLRYIIAGLLFNYLLMATIFVLPMRSRLYLTFITLSQSFAPSLIRPRSAIKYGSRGKINTALTAIMPM